MKHQLCGNGCHQRRARAILILFYSSQITVVLPNRGPAVQEGLRCSQQVEVSVMNLSLTKYRGVGNLYMALRVKTWSGIIWAMWDSVQRKMDQFWKSFVASVLTWAKEPQRTWKHLFSKGGGQGIKDEMGERADYFMNKILQYLQCW